MQAMTESVNCLSEEVSHACTKMTPACCKRLIRLDVLTPAPTHVSSQISTLTQKFKDEVQAYKSNQGY